MNTKYEAMLIGRYTKDVTPEEKKKNQPLIDKAIEDAMVAIQAMNLNVKTPEGSAQANSTIESTINALNIPGFSATIVSTDESALDKLDNVPQEVRDGMKQALEIVKHIKSQNHGLSGLPGDLSSLLSDDADTATAHSIHALSQVLSQYANSRSQSGNSAPQIFHEIGALLGSSLLTVGGMVTHADTINNREEHHSDPIMRATVKMCNRIAIMSFIKYLTTDFDANEKLGIDREEIIKDLRAVLDGNVQDRYKIISESLDAYVESASHKIAGTLN